MCYVALPMLMQPHENVMVSSLIFAAGGHVGQTASTLIPGVASMPDQDENVQQCIASNCVRYRNTSGASDSNSGKCWSQAWLAVMELCPDCLKPD